MHPVDINRLRRRSPGQRVLVYLDQSALSAFARNECDSAILDFMRAEVQAARIVCLRSPEHRDESLRAPRDLWDALDDLSDELAIGIEFRSKSEIEWEEIHAAAGAFVAGEPTEPRDVWREAFDTDPQTPHDDLFTTLFGGQIRVRARVEPSEDEIAEVEYALSKEAPMTAIYAQLRKRFSYEEMAAANLDEMLRWKLGFLYDRERFALGAGALQEEVVTADPLEPDLSPGSPVTRLTARGHLLSQTKYLIERFPDVEQRAAEFWASDELRHAPTLAYPALFRAALAANRKRNAKPGDGYDIDHLTRGLSRCDVVTADRSMTALCRERKLIPAGCELLSAPELSQLPDAITRARVRHAEDTR